MRTQLSADLSAGMSAGCEDDGLPPAPADFHPGLAAYEGMEGLTPMGELESLSTDMGFMGLAVAMPDYSDLEYAAHRTQARRGAKLPLPSSGGCALVNGQRLLPAQEAGLAGLRAMPAAATEHSSALRARVGGAGPVCASAAPGGGGGGRAGDPRGAATGGPRVRGQHPGRAGRGRQRAGRRACAAELQRRAAADGVCARGELHAVRLIPVPNLWRRWSMCPRELHAVRLMPNPDPWAAAVRACARVRLWSCCGGVEAASARASSRVVRRFEWFPMLSSCQKGLYLT